MALPQFRPKISDVNPDKKPQHGPHLSSPSPPDASPWRNGYLILYGSISFILAVYHLTYVKTEYDIWRFYSCSSFSVFLLTAGSSFMFAFLSYFVQRSRKSMLFSYFIYIVSVTLGAGIFEVHLYMVSFPTSMNLDQKRNPSRELAKYREASLVSSDLAPINRECFLALDTTPNKICNRGCFFYTSVPDHSLPLLELYLNKTAVETPLKAMLDSYEFKPVQPSINRKPDHLYVDISDVNVSLSMSRNPRAKDVFDVEQDWRKSFISKNKMFRGQNLDKFQAYPDSNDVRLAHMEYVRTLLDSIDRQMRFIDDHLIIFHIRRLQILGQYEAASDTDKIAADISKCVAGMQTLVCDFFLPQCGRSCSRRKLCAEDCRSFVEACSLEVRLSLDSAIFWLEDLITHEIPEVLKSAFLEVMRRASHVRNCTQEENLSSFWGPECHEVVHGTVHAANRADTGDERFTHKHTTFNASIQECFDSDLPVFWPSSDSYWFRNNGAKSSYYTCLSPEGKEIFDATGDVSQAIDTRAFSADLGMKDKDRLRWFDLPDPPPSSFSKELVHGAHALMSSYVYHAFDYLYILYGQINVNVSVLRSYKKDHDIYKSVLRTIATVMVFVAPLIFCDTSTFWYKSKRRSVHLFRADRFVVHTRLSKVFFGIQMVALVLYFGFVCSVLEQQARLPVRLFKRDISIPAPVIVTMIWLIATYFLMFWSIGIIFISDAIELGSRVSGLRAWVEVNCKPKGERESKRVVKIDKYCSPLDIEDEREEEKLLQAAAMWLGMVENENGEQGLGTEKSSRSDPLYRFILTLKNCAVGFAANRDDMSALNKDEIHRLPPKIACILCWVAECLLHADVLRVNLFEVNVWTVMPVIFLHFASILILYWNPKEKETENIDIGKLKVKLNMEIFALASSILCIFDTLPIIGTIPFFHVGRFKLEYDDSSTVFVWCRFFVAWSFLIFVRFYYILGNFVKVSHYSRYSQILNNLERISAEFDNDIKKKLSQKRQLSFEASANHHVGGAQSSTGVRSRTYRRPGHDKVRHISA